MDKIVGSVQIFLNTDERAHQLQQKQHALELAQEKSIKEKEKLTNKILQYGLWQSQNDIQAGLAKLKTKTAKLKAIKTQFQFRKRVLEQKHSKEIFFMSKSGKQLSIPDLCANFEKLFYSTSSEDNTEFVGKRIRHKWLHGEDGSEHWYMGTIISFAHEGWFNVKYDDEEEIVTVNINEVGWNT